MSTFRELPKADALSKQWMRCPDVLTTSRLLFKHLRDPRMKSRNEYLIQLLSLLLLQEIHYTPSHGQKASSQECRYSSQIFLPLASVIMSAAS